ncbi:MAG: glycosyltransferase family 39 protein [Deltaproteobacteria bacterium]|nr:glycosyltransferase family 39 protein [Deltaproteobacteria bacterium]
MDRKSSNSKLFFIIIAIMAAVPFLVGKYIEFNPPSPYDLSETIYSANRILDGAKIGVDIRPSARLGSLLLTMLGVWVGGYGYIGPKLMQTILQAYALVLMFIAMYKLFGKWPAAVGVIVASVYLCFPLINVDNFKDQCTTTFMMIGVSFFVLYQLSNRWQYAILSGACLSWAPLFKATGFSASFAIGLFVALQPILKNNKWKKTGVDFFLLLLGVVLAIGPLWVWIEAREDMQVRGWIYPEVWRLTEKVFAAFFNIQRAEVPLGYISGSREIWSFSKQWPAILHYYKIFILPITLALIAIVLRIARLMFRTFLKGKIELKTYDRFVLLFAVWWILDMAFAWISPRSYPYYYIPLNASAAMLGGYLIAIYFDKLKNAVHKVKWQMIGVLGLLVMVLMSWHIFIGVRAYPYRGKVFKKRGGGYARRLVEVYIRRRDSLREPWERAGEYIRVHTDPTEKIYVWTFLPGINIIAQRHSPDPEVCRSEMYPYSPDMFSGMIDEITNFLEKQPPKFIVDCRKRHFPWERPPLELWPRIKKGFLGAGKNQFLPLDKDVIERYNKSWAHELRKHFGEDEVSRYEAMKPFREFVMRNYRIVKVFGPHVLFELKNSSPIQNQEK